MNSFIFVSKLFFLSSVLSFTSHQPLLDAFYKKSVLKNFAKFTVKHLCQSHFLNKLSGCSYKRRFYRISLGDCFSIAFTSPLEKQACGAVFNFPKDINLLP